MIYTYDLTQFPNQKCNIDRLTKEIQDSTITIALDSITAYDTHVEINFKANLNIDEKTTLDNIVGNHTGDPLYEPVNTILTDSNGNPINETNPLRTSESINPRDVWEKTMVHDTPRPPDCDTYYTGEGDDLNSSKTIGGGNVLFFSHTTGDSTTDHIVRYIDFKNYHNKSYLYNAWITGQGCLGDFITGKIVTSVTNINTGQSGTDYSLYGGYLIVPAASPLGEGDKQGTISLNLTPNGNPDIKPIECIVLQKTGQKQMGWWNLDYDHDLKEYTNLTPALDGTGNYNLFALEIVMATFVNHFILLGNTTIYLNSFDTAQLPHGSRLKVEVKRNLDLPDHDFYIAINLYMHRQKTT